MLISVQENIIKISVWFGDANIYLSMFKACSYNATMKNGSKEIKETANYITDDVDNDGLYKAFENIM